MAGMGFLNSVPPLAPLTLASRLFLSAFFLLPFFMRDKKSLRGISPPRCSPSPQGAKSITAIQYKSPSGVAEV